jgi:signal transduction histidine kinase/ActR/RegA family two-component response regulator
VPTINFQSIRFRISAVIVIGALFGVLLFEFVWVPRMTQLIVDSQARELRREVEILSDGVLPFLLSNQIGAVYETLQSVEDNYENWVQVLLFADDERLLFPLRLEEVADSETLITETVTIQFQEQNLGRLSVAVDLGSEIQRFRGEVWRMALYGLVIVALILLAIAYVVDKLFTRRLIQVANAADELAVGNYDLSLPKGQDEIGQLADRFDVMRGRIQYQTERLREARLHAETALEARSRFLATMSHEIRTPLNGIIPAAELLAESDLRPEQRHKVDVILTSGKALSTIVDDILDVSMLENGKLVLHQQKFSPADICNEAYDILRSSADSKGLKIYKTCDVPSDLTCIGDANRLRQVLINLLGNAIKFTRNGSISLKASVANLKPNRVRIFFEVSDTGIGIPEDALERIFQRFEQGDEGTARRFGGSGLGLSIVKNLMDVMGGSVLVKSAVGVGSTFSLEIDLEVTTAPVKLASPKTTGANAPGAGLSALVVDDNPVNLTIASAMLARLGFKVDLAENGLSAVSKAGEEKYDVIFMDMQMPEMDGLVATRRIREGEGPNTKTKIVALSASVQNEDVERCRAAGMDSFLAKPLRMERLQDFLTEWKNEAAA